jgi:ubiquinone/menaquinone biosynthesis C-methylase UbiE
MQSNYKKDEWDESYKNKDNYMFYPQEDIIRFISKYIKKRVGLNELVSQNNSLTDVKVLDFGCGIGRHVKTLHEFDIDGYGFDLSSEAIHIAKENFISLGLSDLSDKIIVADILKLPYEDNFFDFMFSHGVLDSMPYELAKNGLVELSRCLKEGGKMYFDLISETGYSCTDENFEKTVETEHEKNTIQTYFNSDRINELIGSFFEIEEIILKNSIDIKKKHNPW